MFRRSVPTAQAGEERKDLFGPVADLMVGVIFIFIILLIGLALHLQPEDYQRLLDRNAQLEAENTRLQAFVRYIRDQQVNALFARIAAANETRAQLLEDMRGRLHVLGIEVSIDTTNGTLKLPAGGIFLTGQAEPTLQGRETIYKLGEVLALTLPCYSNVRTADRPAAGCPKINLYSTLSSVYIEGHTDVVPFGAVAGRFRDNWDLSAGRAIETFKLLRENQPLLRDLRNQDNDTLLGVSGYAETRPGTRAEDRLNETVRDLDRRIEVRLTMTVNEPAVRQAMEELGRQLEVVNDLIP
ncbi:MAG: OmpA/MotB family protein [Azonexus sp.]